MIATNYFFLAVESGDARNSGKSLDFEKRRRVSSRFIDINRYELLRGSRTLDSAPRQQGRETSSSRRTCQRRQVNFFFSLNIHDFSS